MTKPIALAALLAMAVAGCSELPNPPGVGQAPFPPVEGASVPLNFVPYCGPVWSDRGQGYLTIPCPPGSTYPGVTYIGGF